MNELRETWSVLKQLILDYLKTLRVREPELVRIPVTVRRTWR